MENSFREKSDIDDVSDNYDLEFPQMMAGRFNFSRARERMKTRQKK